MICFLNGRERGKVVQELFWIWYCYKFSIETRTERDSVLSLFGNGTMLARTSNAKKIQVTV